MADFASGAIQAFVGPPELGAADDLETTIVGFIDEGQELLDIVVQEIDSPNHRPGDPGCPMARRVGPGIPRTLLSADQPHGKDIAKIGNGPERLTAQWVEPRPSPEFTTNRDILAAILPQQSPVYSVGRSIGSSPT